MNPFPYVTFTILKNGVSIAKNGYYEYRQIPVLVSEGKYNKGDKFTVTVRYNWRNSPANDYTVSVYSKMDLRITGSDGLPSMYFADGRYPSEFIDSRYKGLSECPSKSTTIV